MKTLIQHAARIFLCVPVALSLLVICPAHAGWVQKTSAEIATLGDWDGDGALDLFVLDRESGVLRAAIGQADGVFGFEQPVATGVVDATSMAFGNFQIPDTSTIVPRVLAVTSPSLNRLNLLFEGVVQPAPFSIHNEVGPNLIVNFAGAMSGQFLVASQTNTVGVSASANAIWGSIHAHTLTGALVEAGNAVGLPRPNGAYDFAVIERPGGSTDRFRYLTADENWSWTNSVSVGVPQHSEWAYGNFGPPNVTSFLFWVPDQPTMTVRTRDVQGSLDADPLAFTLSGNIFSIVVEGPETVPALPKRMMVIFDQGTSAGIFTFDGVNVPVLVQTLTPEAGKSFRHAHSVGGDFAMLSGAAGSMKSDSLRRWRRQANGSYVAEAAIQMPSLPGISATRSNVILFTEEPFVRSTADIVSVLTARDWTSSPTGVPNSLAVTAELFQGSSIGLRLSQPLTVSLGASPSSAHFALTNQYAADLSIISYAAPRGDAQADISFNPMPGHYSKPVTVTITSTGAGATIHYYGGNTGPILTPSWKSYNKPLNISTTTTLRAYSETLNGKSPITTGTYTFGNVTPPAANSPDTNGNGLADNWENYFSITDPDGDADNDGLTNKFEHDHGTDPGDPGSGPAITPGAVVISPTDIRLDEGRFSFRMSGTPGRRHKVQWSTNLGASEWTDLGSPFYMPAAGYVDVDDSTLGTNQRRFYRALAW